MDIPEFFRQRHSQLHDQFVPNLRKELSDADFRTRPVEGVQPIVWYIWHMARAEDMGLSRLIWGKPQLLDEEWRSRMGIPLTHYGTSMSEEQVTELAEGAVVDGVIDYFKAVGERTADELQVMNPSLLDQLLTEEEVVQIVRDEGMASEDAQWVIPHYVGRKRGWILCHMGLTHNFRHFGQIALVKKLLLLSR